MAKQLIVNGFEFPAVRYKLEEGVNEASKVTVEFYTNEIKINDGIVEVEICGEIDFVK